MVVKPFKLLFPDVDGGFMKKLFISMVLFSLLLGVVSAFSFGDWFVNLLPKLPSISPISGLAVASPVWAYPKCDGGYAVHGCYTSPPECPEGYVHGAADCSPIVCPALVGDRAYCFACCPTGIGVDNKRLSVSIVGPARITKTSSTLTTMETNELSGVELVPVKVTKRAERTRASIPQASRERTMPKILDKVKFEKNKILTINPKAKTSRPLRHVKIRILKLSPRWKGSDGFYHVIRTLVYKKELTEDGNVNYNFSEDGKYQISIKARGYKREKAVINVK